MSKARKPISKDDAKIKLWEAGVLDWKLSAVQKILKKQILSDPNKISVILSSRRLGKTYLMCSMAIEKCLQQPGAIVKYAFPKQNMAKKMLLPVMRTILDDCPKHIKPTFMTADKVFRFPNGSEIQISGTDNGNIENLRGGDSHLNILDEAGFMYDLTYGVRSVLGPTTKTTGGRTILISTPSRNENHEFIVDWVLPYQAENRITVFTIFDNPNLTPEAIADALSEYPEGDKDPMFRREYLCIEGSSEVTIKKPDGTICKMKIKDLEKEVPRNNLNYLILTPSGFETFDGVAFSGLLETLKFTLEDGRSISVSKKHRFDSDKIASEYIVGDDLSGSKVSSIEDVGNKLCFDILEVPGNHLYLANDIVNHNCEIIRDADKNILPSFSAEIEKAIITDQYQRPVFYDSYVSMDIGGSDLTAVLFGYYDYLNATVVFEDEVIMGKDVNTKTLAEKIKTKEKELWMNKIDESPIPPYLRVSDNNNLILLTDLQRDYQINFIPTRKDNREAAINSLDVAISQKKILINPKCKHLIYHMKFAEWNKNRDQFKKLRDTPNGDIKGGHADALAAAIYFYRNVIKSKNPYPSNYSTLEGNNVFTSSLSQKEVSPVEGFLKNIFKKK